MDDDRSRETEASRSQEAVLTHRPVRVTIGGAEHCLSFTEAHALRDRVVRAIENAAYPRTDKASGDATEPVQVPAPDLRSVVHGIMFEEALAAIRERDQLREELARVEAARSKDFARIAELEADVAASEECNAYDAK